MEETFESKHDQVIVTTPSGNEFVVCDCRDVYWADAIAFALAFLRTENW